MISQVTNSGGLTLDGAQSATVNSRPVKSDVSVESATQQVAHDAKPVDAATAKIATDQINKVLHGLNSDLEFSVDTETKAQIVKVVDTATKEVIRQIPSQDVIEISKALDKLQGMLIKEKA